MRRRHLVPVLLVLTLAFHAACASAPIRKTAILNEQLAMSVLRVQATVTEAYQQGSIPQPTYVGIQSVFKQMSVAGTALNVALAEANEHAALVQAKALLGFVDTLIQQHVVPLPEKIRVYIMVAVEGLRSVLLPMLVALGGA